MIKLGIGDHVFARFMSPNRSFFIIKECIITKTLCMSEYNPIYEVMHQTGFAKIKVIDLKAPNRKVYASQWQAYDTVDSDDNELWFSKCTTDGSAFNLATEDMLYF